MEKISLNPCNLCPRECGTNRENQMTGFCGQTSQLKLARAALHMWEEPCISGECGSGTVFFTGCNLRCIYCQNHDIAQGDIGIPITVSRLSEIFLELAHKGAANINLVTPDHFVPQITKAILLARSKGLSIPIVYNGSGYEKENVIESLSGIVDIFLTDFKYMDALIAKNYSFAEDYPKVAKKALAQMVKQTGKPVFQENGLMKKGVIVRHLLLPGHKKNAKAVLSYVHETYGDQVFISLMNQYTPFLRVKEYGYENLCRKVTKREYQDVVNYALGIGIETGFIQEGETATESFIPDFNAEGLINNRLLGLEEK